MDEDLGLPRLGKRKLEDMTAVFKYWKCKEIKVRVLLFAPLETIMP